MSPVDHLRRDPDALEREVLAAKPGAVKRGKKMTCPAHDDEHPSAGIIIGDDGVARVNCLSCGWHGDILDLRSLVTGKPLADVLAEARGEDDEADALADAIAASVTRAGDWSGIKGHLASLNELRTKSQWERVQARLASAHGWTDEQVATLSKAKLDHYHYTKAANATTSKPKPPPKKAPPPPPPPRPAKKTKPKRGKLHPTRQKAIDAVLWSLDGDGWAVTRDDEYHNPEGDGFASVLRLDKEGEGKEFRPIYRDGKGWRVGDPDGLWPLFHLSTLAGDSRVYMVEGEKCVEAAESIGLIATTSAHGAQSPHKTDWTPLAGRDVVILPDNDEAGRKYAEAAAGILANLDPPATVRIVALPDLADGGDIADFIEARECAESDDIRTMIEKMADAAQPCAPSGTNCEPATLDATAERNERVAKAVQEQSAKRNAATMRVRRADSIAERAVRWLWTYRIARGGLTVFGGLPDCGKSLLTVFIAASVSRGRPWPRINGDSDEALANEVGNVVFIACEDDPATTIVPRLRVAGADLSRVLLVDGKERIDGRGVELFNLAADVRHIEALHEELNGGITLLVIDPLDSYLPGIDTNKGNEVRAALHPLKDWTERSGAAVVIVHHDNKATGGRAIDKVSGSRSFGALPRAIWRVDRDDTAQGENRSLFTPAKANLMPRKVGMAFTIESAEGNRDIPVIHWIAEPVTRTADEIIAGKQNTTRTGDAGDCIKRILAEHGGPMAAADVLERCEQDGHAGRTVRRARADVADCRKVGGEWLWKLPEHEWQEGGDDE